MSDLLGISGSVSASSNTQKAVETALHAAKNEFDITTQLLHLGDYNLDTADGRKLKDYTGDTADVLQHIINSKAYIIGTPVYRGSYSGVLKNLFDLIPRGKWQSDKAPLENRPIGLVATGATDHHFLSVSQELGPIFDFFGAHQVGSGVYVNQTQFTDGEISDNNIVQRLETLGKATTELSQFIDQSTYLSALGPQF